jgi:predicted nuclease with RNAse H fold
VLTVGVDFASQPKRTAACGVRWTAGAVEVFPPEFGVDDERLLALVAEADCLGIDVPLGWPDAFVTAITAHHEGRAWPGLDQRSLCFRETDRVVHRETRWPALSVSSNLIAIPAMRAAAVLSTLAVRGMPVNRAGLGRIVEVYPAAALRRWALPASGYKKKGRAGRCELVQQLQHKAGWLKLPAEIAACCEDDDNGLDALIAALITRAAACGLCDAIPDESLALAEREGWIALPRPGSLQQLASRREFGIRMSCRSTGEGDEGYE